MAEIIEHTLKGEYIELIKLLKFYNVVSSGGEAKMIVESEEVKLNGKLELRKRAKIRVGDQVEALGQVIKVI